MSKNLSIGDTIKCKDADDMINTMYNLLDYGIETEFLYEKDGKLGLWLIVTWMPLPDPYQKGDTDE